MEAGFLRRWDFSGGGISQELGGGGQAAIIPPLPGQKGWG